MHSPTPPGHVHVWHRSSGLATANTLLPPISPIFIFPSHRSLPPLPVASPIFAFNSQALPIVYASSVFLSGLTPPQCRSPSAM